MHTRMQVPTCVGRYSCTLSAYKGNASLSKVNYLKIIVLQFSFKFSAKLFLLVYTKLYTSVYNSNLYKTLTFFPLSLWYQLSQSKTMTDRLI